MGGTTLLECEIFTSGFRPRLKNVACLSSIRELKQTRRRQKRERHLKMSLRVSAITFQLFKFIMFQKRVLTNWN